jgi:YesN/AraC family two-component response regulator
MAVMDYPLIESLEELKILLVDDDSFMQRLLENVLTELGFVHIEKAANGEEALDILRQSHIDLLVTDIQMPVMNGLELLRQVRSGLAGESHKLRTIIITSFSNLDTLGTAIALDVNGFLEKPFKPVTVIKKILVALSEEEQNHRPSEDYQNIETNLSSLAVLSHVLPDERVDGGGAVLEHSTPVRPTSTHMLQPGMKLAENVCTTQGTLLLPEGLVLTWQSIHRIHELSDVIDRQELDVYPVW